LKDKTIPQLRRKFRLLVDYGHFKNLEAIADALGKKPGTIKSWADGGDRWEPGRIATASYDDVIGLFEKAISRYHTVSNVDAAVKGRTIDLEALFKPPPSFTLTNLIKQEAVTNCGHLIKVDRPMEVVETSNAPFPQTDHSVRQDASFRIVFNNAGSGAHVLALQNARQGWGFVSAALNATKQEILVPGLNDDGSIANMSEHHWIGINRFIAIQTSVQFPRNILVAIDDKIHPDSILLQELVEFYAAQPFGKRKLFVLSALVEGNGGG